MFCFFIKFVSHFREQSGVCAGQGKLISWRLEEYNELAAGMDVGAEQIGKVGTVMKITWSNYVREPLSYHIYSKFDSTPSFTELLLKTERNSFNINN